MAYANQYGSGINLDALMVNTKAATVFAAQEQSLYMSGQIVPVVNVPAGSATAQVPVMGSVTASIVSGTETDPGADFATSLAANTKNEVNLDLFAARSVIRDLGGVNTAEIGRILGNAVATATDQEVTKKMKDLTAQEITSGNLDLEEIFAAVATIRGAGEGGQLYGIVSTDAYAALMTAIGSTAYAGGDFQTEALRNGFVGTIAGVRTFVSSHLSNAVWTGTEDPKMCVFGADALRIATQGGMNVEIERRAAAVGFDVVASMAMGAKAIDPTRGVKIIDAV